jgi:hypothetical protein
VAFAEAFPALAHICVEGSLTDKALVRVAEICTTRLRELRLSFIPAITDIALNAVALHCTNLETLHIVDCSRLTHSAIAGLKGSCRSLGNAEFNDFDYKGVAGFSAGVGEALQYSSLLTKLTLNGFMADLAGKQADELIISIAERCSNLAHLNLDVYDMLSQRRDRGSWVSDDSICIVAQRCTKLMALGLGGCRVTDVAVLSVAKGCPFLTALDVSRNQKITDASVVILAESCPKLRLLNMMSDGDNGTVPRITQASVLAIAKHCTDLEAIFLACVARFDWIGLDTCQIPDSAILSLVEMCGHSLRQFHLESCHTGDLALTAIGGHCTRISHLSLKAPHGIDDITDKGVAALAACTALEFLSLEGCMRITDQSTILIATGCQHLTAVNMSGSKIGDKTIELLAMHCPRLSALDAKECKMLTACSLDALAAHCSSNQLRSIDFGGCKLMRPTDHSVMTLARRFTQLSSLTLPCCSELSNKAVFALAEHCTKLGTLNLESATRITDKALQCLNKTLISEQHFTRQTYAGGSYLGVTDPHSNEYDDYLFISEDEDQSGDEDDEEPLDEDDEEDDEDDEDDCL